MWAKNKIRLLFSYLSNKKGGNFKVGLLQNFENAHKTFPKKLRKEKSLDTDGQRGNAKTFRIRLC